MGAPWVRREEGVREGREQDRWEKEKRNNRRKEEDDKRYEMM